MNGTLYLLPCPLGDTPVEQVLPSSVLEQARRITHFVVEHPKSARHFLAALQHPVPVRSLQLETLNEHTEKSEIPRLLAPLLAGEDVAIVSEAGCPGVADPGAELVALAHHHGVRVIPLIGPSSILLALMGSGLNGQSFAFHGYLPIEDCARQRKIADLERFSARGQQTQIFIETPYRNTALFGALLQHCKLATRLCIAASLTLEAELIVTLPISEWRARPIPELHKRPCLFLLLA